MASKKKPGFVAHDHPPPEGKVRQSQAITTYGPGAMVDLVSDAVLMGGLEFWAMRGRKGFDEPRLRARLLDRFPELRSTGAFMFPPEGDDRDPGRDSGIQALEFPRWFVCQNPECRTLARRGLGSPMKAERYVHDCAPKGSFFVPVRFVMACENGHIQDFVWDRWVTHKADCQTRDLQLAEGPTGDFAELLVRCKSCRARRPLIDATVTAQNPECTGQRPWLGDPDPAGCDKKLRLLVRTASNSYFAELVSALTIPAAKSARDAVRPHLDVLAIATPETLPVFLGVPKIAVALKGYAPAEILKAIADEQAQRREETEPLRTAEFKKLVSSAVEKAGEYPGLDEEFFARTVTMRDGLPAGVARVVLAHKLREVRVQTGFTRFEASTPDLQGERPSDPSDLAIKPAPLASRIRWLPGIVVRGEGVFLQLDEQAVRAWEGRDAVLARVRALHDGHKTWKGTRDHLPFYGGRFYLLHSLAHLLIQAMSLECGYSASAIRERIYCAPAQEDTPMAAILLSTGTTGAEGTLGGLLEQGRALRQHLRRAHDSGVLCSNDPVCAAHDPTRDPTGRYLEGAACHGCLFIAEPSCEQFNRFLDRALVFPTIGHEGAAFFRSGRDERPADGVDAGSRAPACGGAKGSASAPGVEDGAGFAPARAARG
jgi:hypothetical protein